MPNMLTFSQVMIMVFTLEVGIYALSLPRLLAENIGTNSWAALPIYGLLAALNIWILSAVYRLGKGASIFAITKRTTPAYFYFPLFCGIAFIWAMLGSMIAKQYVLILIPVSFPTLHPSVLLLMMEALIFILLIKGIISIANAGIIFFFSHVVVTPFLMSRIHNEFSLSRMTTFWFKEGSYSPSGLLGIYTAFLGFELCLLLFPYVNERTHLFKAVQWGNVLVILNYTINILIMFGFFSLQQLQHLKFPALNAVSFLEFPFIQRIDDFLINLTLFRILMTSTCFSWAAVETLKQLLPTNKIRWFPYGILVISISITLFVLPDTLEKFEEWLNLAGYIETGVALLLPVLLITLLLLNRFKERRHA